MQEKYLSITAEDAYNSNFILTHHAAIDITGDLIAGILFDRIYYWFQPDQNGRTKLRVFKDGFYWLVKSRSDWYEEIRISPTQYDRAAKILLEQNLIIVEKWKFGGTPMTHIRINMEEFRQRREVWRAELLKTMMEDSEKQRQLEIEKINAQFAAAGNEQSLAPVGISPNVNMNIQETLTSTFRKPELQHSGNLNVNVQETLTTITKNTTGNTTKITSKENNNNCAANAARESSEPSGDKKTAKKRSIPKTEIDKEFNILWELYPTGRKQGKVKAKESFAKARNEGVSFDTIKDGLEAYNRYIEQNRVARKFVKMAQTWFNNRSWEDEYEENGGGMNGTYGSNHAENSGKGTVYGNFIG